ncbi:hypothetical protein CC1G_14707 [Coprinopsis cinerea okayama7|uniref:Uncharacterized protein n=1 Tax=Coprinopsis cinerea (strain Okayama-7 / 130 / ATCC MYA-4618 / FGSC 9003) TaxID=240176 RepID=D6RMT2_COPC7|nr:hypothetical protein CC1G_14707 [Coprinopsis cinerea okayama7\|eukprot:XP_002911278.1 hypothetical protein CC1G_14707 [Coprinopsis cinerea okayama7\
MNVFYNQDLARLVLDSHIARASQEDGQPMLLADADPNSLSVVQFENPSTYRLTQRDDPESETYFKVIGVLCSKVLPPFQTTPKIRTLQHLRNLRQFVKVTGLGSTSFSLAGGAMESVVELFKQALGSDALVGTEEKLYEGDLALDFHARYFTDREVAPQEKHIPFDDLVDPQQILETLRGTRFIHGPDNRVEYCVKRVDPDGKTRYEPVDPASIKEGDIVEVTLAFMCVPIKENRYRFLPTLRAVTLLESRVRKESEAARDQGRFEVLKRIVEHAGIFDLLSLSGTSRKVRLLARNEVDRRVIELMELFSLNAHTTLLLLRDTKAYISGSAVLSIIDPGMFTPGDLDFYVPMAHAHKLWMFLWRRHHHGWHQLIGDRDFQRAGLPIPDPDDYCGIPGIATVWYFKHRDTGKVINVIITRTSSALPAIIRFHSTIVMNVITYFGVGEYYGYHAHARTKVSRPLGAIKGLQKGELKVAVGGKGNVNGQRAKSAIDDLQRYTFELAVGRGELQRRVLSLEAMIEDMASIIYGVRVSKKESAETGMERLERMMEARRGDVWMDMPETCYGDFSV